MFKTVFILSPFIILVLTAVLGWIRSLHRSEPRPPQPPELRFPPTQPVGKPICVIERSSLLQSPPMPRPPPPLFDSSKRLPPDTPDRNFARIFAYRLAEWKPSEPMTTIIEPAVKTRKEIYDEYLRSEHWHMLRTRILERDGHMCVRPGCGETEKLSVHHKIYREPLEDALDEDLETLCRKHHMREHPYKTRA